jgi:hypothetical protein
MKSVITNNGLNLLSKTRADGTVQYWLGYFGLAYVPDELRDEEEAISAGMDSLTIKGDNIYNIFQGSMVPRGFDTDREDSVGTKSPASKLYNECMYTSDIMSRYRYVLDKNDNNQLIVFKGVNPEGKSAGIAEYFDPDDRPFKGISSSSSESSLPIPAPLYYLGEPKSYDEVPSGWNPPVVSCDTRDYSSSTDVDSPSISDDTWANADNYDWTESKEKVYTDGTDLVSYTTLDKFWQHQSVSNFNRFHAPANYEGYAVDYDPATRNICKATKLFPIGHYDVKSTASEEKVSTVQYTVDINLNSVFDSVAANATRYYDKNGVELTGNPYPVGFKFNRVGIYAVSVTLHAYNTDDPNGDCAEHNIQMQVNGEQDPVLFAVIDLDSPVVMKQGGLMDFSFKLDVNLGADSSVVDNTTIYYNLYEDDAITWYKNQLIANASTADAITTLGIQMNYLRKQMASMSTDSSSCGLGDDGDRYALAGHTHNFIKNIVDVDFESNGAVRGIFTQTEGVQFPVNTGLEGTYNSGTDSMTLGKGSMTDADFSFNLSSNGVVGSKLNTSLGRSESVLMMGKSSSDNNYAVLEEGFNSIVNTNDDVTIPLMTSSIFISHPLLPNNNSSGVIQGSSIVGSMRLGHDNDLNRVRINEYLRDPNSDIQYKIDPTTGEVVGYTIDPDTQEEIRYDVPNRSLSVGSVVNGSVNLIGGIYNSLLTGNGPSYQQVTVGAYDIQSDMNCETLSGKYNAFVNKDSSTVRAVIGTLNVTNMQTSTTRAVVALDNSLVPTGSSNVLMVGNAIGTHSDCVVGNVYTLKEYKDYAEGNSDIPFHPTKDIVVGDTISITKDGVERIINANGIACYISYSTDIKDYTYYTAECQYKIWEHEVDGETVKEVVPVGRDGYVIFDESANAPEEPVYLGTNLDATVRQFQKPGLYKNLVMVGDDLTPGNSSSNSIFIGDGSAWPKVTFKNSFINLLGDRYPSQAPTQPSSPKVTFDNVFWIGHISGSSKIDGRDTGKGDNIATNTDFISNTLCQLESAYQSHVSFKDAFVFIGSNRYAYEHAYWYGVINDTSISTKLNALDSSIKKTIQCQPTKSPMIYTGGIALGGYGNNESNFMLMKVGTSRNTVGNYPDTGDSPLYPIVNYDSYGNNKSPNILTYSVWDRTGNSNDFTLTDTVYYPDDPTTILYKEYTTVGGLKVKEWPSMSDEQTHYTTKSPFAGHVLMVQEDQELDGTLHVGLGKVNNNVGIMVICEMEGSDGTNRSQLPDLTVMMNGQFLDSPSTAFSSPGFSMEGITKILWYTPCSYLPMHTSLYINMDDMTDGIVYEIEMNRTASVGDQASYEAMCGNSLGVYFTYHGSTITPNRWGSSQFSAAFVKGEFSVPHVTNGGTDCTVKFDTQLYKQTSLPIHAVAKIYFMKLVDKMYVLGY